MRNNSRVSANISLYEPDPYDEGNIANGVVIAG